MAEDNKATKRVDLMLKSILRQFPELDEMQLRFAISDGFTELALNGINEEVSELNDYFVEYWYQNQDDYDFNTVLVQAHSPEEAINMVKTKGGIDTILDRFIDTPRNAKNFNIVE